MSWPQQVLLLIALFGLAAFLAYVVMQATLRAAPKNGSDGSSSPRQGDDPVEDKAPRFSARGLIVAVAVFFIVFAALASCSWQ